MNKLHRDDRSFRSGGPHAGLASQKMEVGWRNHARGPNSAGRSPHPTGGDRLIRPWPGQGHGRKPATRSGTDLIATRAIGSATGPVRCPDCDPLERIRPRGRPGGWLGPHAHETAGCQRNRVGLRLLPAPAARYGKSLKAFLPPGPVRSPVHPASGSARSVARGDEGGEEMVGLLRDGAARFLSTLAGEKGKSLSRLQPSRRFCRKDGCPRSLLVIPATYVHTAVDNHTTPLKVDNRTHI